MPFWQPLLRCPVCHAPVVKEGNSLLCLGARRHCFDCSAAGYVNLASARAAGGGDDAALIAARSAFLGKGHYAPIAARITEWLSAAVPQGAVVDAGCGEGYYTVEMAKAGLLPLGFDLSKNGIRHAARLAHKENAEVFFGVAGLFDLPVADGAVDAVVSLFAPVAEEEFLRVLRPGGYLLLAGAGPRHLFALKELLYDTPYLNKPRADAPKTMRLVREDTLRFSMELTGEELQALFAMTPYYYRTPRAGVARLAAAEALSVGAEVDFSLWQKPEE